MCASLSIGRVRHASSRATAASQVLSAAQIETLREQLNGLQAASGFGLLSVGAARTEAPERALSLINGVTRTRTTTINDDYLQSLLLSPRLEVSREGRLSTDAQVYTLNLFDDVSVRVAKIDVVRDVLDNDVWRGAVLNDAGGEATLVVNKGSLTAQIRIGNENYSIQPTANGQHTVIQYDLSRIPLETDDVQRRDDVLPLPEPDLVPSPPECRSRIKSAHPPLSVLRP